MRSNVWFFRSKITTNLWQTSWASHIRVEQKNIETFFWLKKINRQRFFDDFRHVRSPGKVADVVAVAVADVAVVVETIPSHFKSLHGFFTSFFSSG